MKYFEIIQQYTPDYIEPESPILINDVAVIKDTVDDEMLLRVTFANSGDKSVIAIDIKINTWDIFGEKVLVDGHDTWDYVYQDIIFTSNSVFGNKIPIKLPSNVRRADVSVYRLVYEDGTVWHSSGNRVHVQKQALLEGTDDFVQTINAKEDNRYPAIFSFIENDECWQCTCGAVNRIETTKCYRCGRDKYYCKNELGENVVHIKYEEYENAKKKAAEEARLKQEAEEREAERIKAIEKKKQQEIISARKAEEERQRVIAAEASAKKRKKRDKIIFSCAVVVACLCLVVFGVIPQIRYSKAKEMYANEQYTEAAETFVKLGDFKDSREYEERSQKLDYFRKAANLAHGGNTKDARKLLTKAAAIEANLSENDIEVADRFASNVMSDENYIVAQLMFYQIRQSCEQETEKWQLIDYKYGLCSYNARDLTDAYDAFVLCAGYQDSASYLLQIIKGKIAGGSSVFLGHNNLYGNNEKIEWTVLKRNSSHFLLLAKKAQAVSAYSNDNNYGSWSTSVVRKLLNSDFYQKCFTIDEQDCIMTTKVPYIDSKGVTGTTKDHVYVLSSYEYKKYMPMSKDRRYETISGLSNLVPGIALTRTINATSEDDNTLPKVEGLYKSGIINSIKNRTLRNTFYVQPAMWINLENIDEVVLATDILNDNEIKSDSTTEDSKAASNSSSVVQLTEAQTEAAPARRYSGYSSSSRSTYSSSNNHSFSSNDDAGYDYDPSDPYYSANDHNHDGKINTQEFQDAMNDTIDDLLEAMEQ